MDPITAGMMGAAAISSAGSIGGSLLSGDMSKKAADKAGRWQLYLSSTAHQRAVEDLRKAGLNPLLALNNPASTPGYPMPNIPDLGQSLASGVNSAVSFATQKLAMKSAKLDLEAKKAMYKMVDEFPVVKKLFYSGMLASTAGLPGTIFAPLMAAASSKAVQSVMEGVKSSRYQNRPRQQGENVFEYFLDDVLKRGHTPDLEELFKNQK